MTEFLIIKDQGTWRPADELAWEKSRKFPSGVPCLADVRDPSRRSNAQHAFWFAMIQELFRNQEKHTNFDHFRTLILIHLGYCDLYPKSDGTFTPIALSLKFGKMPQDEFTALVDSTLGFAEELGWDKNELLAKTKEAAP